MGRRDDFEAALQGRQPAHAVPLWELEFHAWDAFSGGHLIVGPEFEALTPARQARALDADADLMLAVAEQLGFAALSIPLGPWEIAPGIPAYYWLPDPARYDLVAALRRRGPGDLLLCVHTGGVLGMPMAHEYVDFSYKLFDAPEEIDARARDLLGGALLQARRFRDLGAGAAYTASDLADNHGFYYSPPQMERFVLPYLREWAAGVRELGLYAILHTDGNIMRHLDAIAASGIHLLQAIDPIAGMDIRRVKAQVAGRVALCGNVDCGLLLTGTPEAIYAATRDLLLDLKPGGGFVLGASNAVQREVPVENYRAMNRAWRDHGAYG